MNNRVINIEGVHNIRDLGGLTGLDGRKIRKNLLIRSSRLILIQEDGLKYFKDINLRTIIDMRTTFEAKKRPDPEIEGVAYYRIGVLSEKPEEMGATYSMLARAGNEDQALVQLLADGFDMSRVYMDFVEQPFAIHGMSSALKMIAAQPEGEALLYHCNGGKDRTGTLTVFLLTILGVDQDTIMDDFEMTNLYFADEIERLQNVARSITDDEKVISGMQTIAGVSRRNMDLAMDSIVEKYGSVMTYITDVLEITDEEINEIRRKYLED